MYPYCFFPIELERNFLHNMVEKNVDEKIMSCIECGLENTTASYNAFTVATFCINTPISAGSLPEGTIRPNTE